MFVNQNNIFQKIKCRGIYKNPAFFKTLKRLTKYKIMPLTKVLAWGWCTGTTQRDGTGREEGGGFRMGNTCIPVADSC